MNARYLSFFLNFVIAFVLFHNTARGQNTIPSYDMVFQFKDANQSLKDTAMPRLKYRAWSKSDNYPSYVQWKNLPFAVLLSPLNGVGLYTDSLHSFAQYEAIGYAFIKMQQTGHFSFDYVETNAGSFVNDAVSPNMTIEITPQGLLMRANTAISPNTELSVSYQDLIDLFQGDPEVMSAIKYW